MKLKEWLKKFNFTHCQACDNYLSSIQALKKSNEHLLSEIDRLEQELVDREKSPQLLFSKEQRATLKITKAEEKEVTKLYKDYPKGLEVIIRFIEKQINLYTEQYVQFQEEKSNHMNKAYRELWRFMRKDH